MRATGDFNVLHFKVLRVVWLESQRIRWGQVHVQWSTHSVKYQFSEVLIQWSTNSVKYSFSKVLIQWRNHSVKYSFNEALIQWTTLSVKNSFSTDSLPTPDASEVASWPRWGRAHKSDAGQELLIIIIQTIYFTKNRATNSVVKELKLYAESFNCTTSSIWSKPYIYLP